MRKRSEILAEIGEADISPLNKITLEVLLDIRGQLIKLNSIFAVVGTVPERPPAVVSA